MSRASPRVFMVLSRLPPENPGLSPGTEYWFALRTADEVPNWSLVSNSVNATTLQNATPIDDTPPTVNITSPEQGSDVSGAVLVRVQASDDTGVVEVVILLDGSLATTLREDPYIWVWSTEATAPGSHTLKAEAIDPAGNVGSAEVQVVVLARDRPEPGIKPGPVPPTVDSIIYDPTEGRFDLGFSRPMNPSSVLQALSIEPGIPYMTAWHDDANLTIVLSDTAHPDVSYTLTIAGTAADTDGTSLAEPFAFGFTGMGPGGDPTVAPDMWLRVSLLLIAGLAAVIGFHLWSRTRNRLMRRNLSRISGRLEELKNVSQERMYRELAELEVLASGLCSAPTRRAGHIPRTR